MSIFETTFITANVRGAFDGMPQEAVREDLLQIREEDPGVLALQEFWRPRYNRAARNVFRPDYRLRTPWWRSPSLAWSADLFAVDGSVDLVPLHARVPGRSDARQILGQPLDPWTGRAPFTAISTHRAPGPWNLAHVANLIEYADQEVRAGRAVWIGADLNTHASQPLGDRIGGHAVRYVQNGVDFQIFIDSDHYGWNVNRGTKRLIRGNSDHAFLAVDAGLRRRR